MSEPLKTIEQVMEYLNVTSKWSIYRYIKAGMPFVPLDEAGFTKRFRISEIDAWLNRRREPEKAPSIQSQPEAEPKKSRKKKCLPPSLEKIRLARQVQIDAMLVRP